MMSRKAALLLTIDVGNTHTVIGAHEKEKLHAHWRIATRRDQTSDEYAILFRSLMAASAFTLDDIEGVAVASVVPSLTSAVVQLSRLYLQREPLVIEPGIKTGMPVLYEPPGDVGADRIVNAVAALTTFGGPVIVVDFGTATTFDVVTRQGEYAGGLICPGISISADALFRCTSRLPQVEIRNPGWIIGRSTVGSIQSGLYFGYSEMVKGILARISSELGERARVVATGGLAEILAQEIPDIEAVDPVLTLTGLRLVWEKNR